MSAPLKPINSDPDDNSPRDLQTTTDVTKPVTVKRLQKGDLDLPWAVYIHVKQGHETQGNIKRLRNDQLTQEVQRASRGLYVKLPSITKIAWVTRATIYNKICSLGLDAQVRVRLEPALWPTKQ